MASEIRAIAGNANSPWGDLPGWAVITPPRTPLWTQDGIYEALTPTDGGGNWSQTDYFMNPASGFTSIGTGTVDQITLTLIDAYGDGASSDFTAALLVGTGNYLGATIFSTQTPAVVVSIDVPPGPRSITWPVLGATAAYIKTNMTSSNFLVGVSITAKPGSSMYIDTAEIQIDYTEASGPSLQKKFLKSFSTFLAST